MWPNSCAQTSAGAGQRFAKEPLDFEDPTTSACAAAEAGAEAGEEGVCGVTGAHQFSAESHVPIGLFHWLRLDAWNFSCAQPLQRR